MESTLSANRPKLQPWIHTDYGSGIPYYDEELGLMQGDAHKEAVTKYGPCFDFVAEKLGLKYLSDQPIWFLEPEKKKQVSRAGDLVLAKQVDVSRITVESVLFYMEIVSTDDPRREKKDTMEKKPLCEYNGVPEFGLYFPDLKDERVFEFYRLLNGVYYPILENESGKWCSEIIDGLCIERLTEDEWKEGVKIRIWFEGEVLLDLGREMEMRKRFQTERDELEQKWGDAEVSRWEEKRRREIAEEREKLAEEREKKERKKRKFAEEREQEERKKREITEKEKTEALSKAKALAEKLKALGIDPDS